MSELKVEGVVLLDEGVKGSVTYRNFSAPGKRCSWRRQWFAGSVAMTKLRFVGVAYSTFLINVPFSDQRIRAMHYSIEADDVFTVTFDAALFHADWSGTIEYRFKTAEAQRLLERLDNL